MLCNSLPNNYLHRKTRNQVAPFAAKLHFTGFLLVATVFSGSAKRALASRIRKLHSESDISGHGETGYFSAHNVSNRS
jgi:hypothetical protein